MNKVQQTKRFLAFLMILGFSACEKKEDNDVRDLALAGIVVATQTPYIEITPSRGSISIPIRNSATFTRSFDPQCTGVSGNTTFKFYLKRGSTKNLLINFMGGGACWDAKNCLGTRTTTYFNRAGIFSPLVARGAFQGIMEERDSRNPFQNWNVLFVPYCSGDLHWGSKETVYVDPNSGANVTFQHRGFDNFLASLDYVMKNEDYKPDSSAKIFVTGQSAGGYGAIYNFPYIQEAFPNNEVLMLGDAANGVVPTGFANSAVINRWGADQNVPTWVGVTAASFPSLSLGSFYNTVATFYNTRRFAQYSTNFDGNQRFFYEVQLKIQGGNSFYASPVTYTDSATLWGNSNGTEVRDAVSCDWVTQSRTKIVTEAGARSNYRYYIASGDVHTISTANAFYTENSAGQSLLDWYNQMLAGSSAWVNRDCRTLGTCSPPATVTSTNGLSCP